MMSGEPALSGLLAGRYFGLSEGAALSRLAPGYLYLPRLFRLADLLQGVTENRLLVGSVTHGETLEQIAQRCHRLEPVHEAADARSRVVDVHSLIASK
jgi:hypothetical protein